MVGYEKWVGFVVGVEREGGRKEASWCIYWCLIPFFFFLVCFVEDVGTLF